MASQFFSKHGTVSKSPAELYMGFTDMRLFVNMLPEDKKQGITADCDSIKATVQGITIGVRIINRVPYSRIDIESTDSPFNFGVCLYFDEAEGGKTDFHIAVDAEMNMMMKMMAGKKIQEGLDMMVDGLVKASEGRI